MIIQFRKGCDVLIPANQETAEWFGSLKSSELIELEVKSKHRTPKQNNAMWKLFRDVARKLQDAGIDARKFFKPEVEIPVTPEMLHRDAFNPIVEAMFNKTSSELETKEMSEAGDIFIRHLAQRHGIDAEWPHRED